MEDELQDLLQQLDDTDKPKSVSPDKAVPNPDKVSNQEPVVVDPDQIEKIGSISTAAATTITEITPPTAAVDVHKYYIKLDGVTDEILTACRADRQEAQDVIHLLRDQIEQSLNKNQLPSRMYIDGLVQAVEVKANINMTAVKIIEANAKMLAATKVTGNNVMVNNNLNVANGANDGDLERILSEPITNIDEF